MTKPIFLLGEARGTEEDRLQSTFVGGSGMELIRMLCEAGLMAKTDADKALINSYYRTKDARFTLALWDGHPEFYRTNVFQIHPPRNDLTFFTGSKSEALPGYPPLIKSKHVREEFAPELARLQHELLTVDPNLVICFGNTALWAMTGKTGIMKLRGATTVSTHTVSGFKLLPTYHPAAIMRQWENRPTVIADLMKAAREASTEIVSRPKREIWIEPSLDDIRTFIHDHVRGCPLLSVDIETSGTRITCIGLAPQRDLGIVIPFDDERAASGSYWPDQQSEHECWNLVRSVLLDQSIPKLFQNGLYDITFLWRAYGIRTFGATQDTMLLQHALHPEALKGLGYLGSLYSDEMAWKPLGKRPKTIKRGN